MKARYDPQADALYVRFTDTPVAESEEVRPGLVLDFDADGRIVGIEIIAASDHLASGTDLSALTAGAPH